MRKKIQLNNRQKGFVPVDGCFENVSILKKIIEYQRKKKKAYQIVFLDLAKAFDTVSHESIKKALMRKGVPTEIIAGIMEMYNRPTTVIGVGGKFTRKININAGFKQGCTLLSLPFNIIMDELLERIVQKKVGIKVGGEIIRIMAFADDLVVLAEDPGDMTVLVECSEDFFDEKGLSVNPTKCVSLKVVAVKGKKVMKVITATRQCWKGEPISSIDFEKLGKYLGLHINHAWKVELPRKMWKAYIEKIKKSCPTPLQKVRVIKEVIRSKILYQLRLLDHGLEEARKLNRIIRDKIKEILHLPSWTSTD